MITTLIIAFFVLLFLAAHPRHALGYIFGRPGWSHDGSRETSRSLRADWAARAVSAEESPPPQPAPFR